MSARESLPLQKSPVTVRAGANPILTFQDEVNKLFHNFFGDVSLPRWKRAEDALETMVPALDVVENDKEFVIAVDLPGMEAKDIDISAAEGYITIKGEKKQTKKEECFGYYRQERSYGSFQRVVGLPNTANLDKVDASFRNGVLKLQIAKKAGAPSKEHKIQIKQFA